MSMEMEAKLTVYEIDGTEKAGGADVKLAVKSHWNRKGFVLLQIGKTTYTVSASDLREATSRCSNY